MAEPTVAHHLSIGEVLGLLLEEFPDVTISKIRFLESQGLIEPERTPSGYRKFYDADVELLRLILREQREHFLPLRVIKDRLDSGQIEPSGDVVAKHPAAAGGSLAASATEADSPAAVSAPTHPSRRSREAEELAPTPAAMPRPGGATDVTATAPRLLPGVVVSRDELCGMAKISPAELAQLEEYGVIGRRKGLGELYSEEAVEIAAAAGRLLDVGIDARHLRAWRTSVEREVGLFEQIVVPLLRQRNPQARTEAAQQIEELSAAASRLRAALLRAAIKSSLDL